MTLLYIWFISGLISAIVLLYQLSRAEDPVSLAIRSQPYGPFAVVSLALAFGTIGLAVVVWELLTDVVSRVGSWWKKRNLPDDL